MPFFIYLMRLSIFLSAAFILLAGCYPENAESPLRGNLHVLIPESVAPALVQQVDAFQAVYGAKGANVTYSVVTSEEAIERFLRDTLRAFFSTRALSPEEKQRAEEQTGLVVELKIFYDGIAVVVHHKNPVERITTSELRGILGGTISKWDRLNDRGSMRGVIRVHVQEESDISSYVQGRFPGLSVRKEGKESSLEILRAVARDPQAIGLVGLDWIDSAAVPAKVLEVAALQVDADTLFKPPVETIGKFYSPHPAHIYRSYYPLKRAVYFYSRSLRGDLSSGFAAFVGNKEGQRLFLERGLVPATQPIRLRPSE